MQNEPTDNYYIIFASTRKFSTTERVQLCNEMNEKILRVGRPNSAAMRHSERRSESLPRREKTTYLAAIRRSTESSNNDHIGDRSQTGTRISFLSA